MCSHKTDDVHATDGYIISAISLYFADTQNNDASITKNIFLTNSKNVNDWLQLNDLLTVDRGFRDCLAFLENLGLKTKMPAFLNKAEKSFQPRRLMKTDLLQKSGGSWKVQMEVPRSGAFLIVYCVTR